MKFSDRYDRQIMLFGEKGQKRLSEAKVFIAGAGGLGSPVAVYLAIAGIKRLVIADCDTVSLSNLNRQFLHTKTDINSNKTDSARETLERLNDDVKIMTVTEPLSKDNILGLTIGCDLIIDCLDNFKTRHVLNRAAIEKNIPLIHGAVSGWDGQATTIIPGHTPCLECIFPNIPPKEKFPIVGTTAGVIGTMQANEAVRILTGNGATMAGRLLIWDGRASSIDEMHLLRDEKCPACSKI
ncbi:HesA/MoeB/ThiF family protein [Methanoplanus sp. FWC-SCC4]|uniref:HesA/MoeB/ThiF family protein n=1 Tax=Methanochimaera problematica TaxID=2609417 RepID=A0AA97FCY9_9EURY|nr:HesA/MoeB/ThiF family protein [Methanoplanus sp. FWC-SCC4]WOF15186.1 HesA/MoeB/ThiF family protein [Methanoplanus sp. FWC-SCC4]